MNKLIITLFVVSLTLQVCFSISGEHMPQEFIDFVAKQQQQGLIKTQAEVSTSSSTKPLWQQLQSDIYTGFYHSRKNYCDPLNGNYKDANTRVLCTGNIEVIGFPCTDCPTSFDWGDYDSVKRCTSQECKTAGLDDELVGFTGSVNLIGNQPQLAEGTTYVNSGKSDDFEEFQYTKSESVDYRFEVKSGVHMKYSESVEVNEIVAKETASFDFELNFETSATTETVNTHSWSALEHVTVPGNSRTEISCFLWSNSFRGNYDMSIKAWGHVLVVVWNKDGTKNHPYYVYYAPNTSIANVQAWLPHGYQYKSSLSGLEGIEVKCNKTVHKLSSPEIISYEEFTPENQFVATAI